VHGDAHTGNFMMAPLEDDGFEMTLFDFDNSQRSWYIVDPGTLLFSANFNMWLAHRADRLERIGDMKRWFLEEYGWDTTEEELVQGCAFRHDFMKYAAKGFAMQPKLTKGYVEWSILYGLFLAGKVPTC